MCLPPLLLFELPLDEAVEVNTEAWCLNKVIGKIPRDIQVRGFCASVKLDGQHLRVAVIHNILDKG